MSQAPPPPRTRVEFTEESIRRRQFVSRLFRAFALAATFFGLAVLLVFLTRLAWDVALWFQATPAAVRAQNARTEADRQRLADPKQARADRLAQIRREMDAELAAPGADRGAIERFYNDELIPRELANLELTLAEQRREAEAGYRPDTSGPGVLWHFVTSGPAPENAPQDAGILYGLLGTVYVVLVALLVAVPIGVGAAIYLEEYRSTSYLAQVIQVNINNLAGVPSVIFGILGAFLFVELIFRPVEAEMARPGHRAEYQERYEKLAAAGRVQEAPRDDAHLVRLVVDPEGTLDRIRSAYDQLAAEGKAPAAPRSDADRIRVVLDPTDRLVAYEARYRGLLADGTIDRLVREKKLAAPARSPLEIPEQVLVAEGKPADAVKRETAWLAPLKEAEARAARVAVDQRLLTPPNGFIRGLAALFRWAGVSLAARNVLGGGLTLALLILPIVIVASQEAIRAVPGSLRHGSLALGATRWQTIRHVVLPAALPGILTGTILSMCRAMGEAAPLILFGATLYVDQAPGLFSRFTVLPMQIFVWTDRVGEDWRRNAALASFLLLLVLLAFNAVAIYLRQRAQSKTRY